MRVLPAMCRVRRRPRYSWVLFNPVSKKCQPIFYGAIAPPTHNVDVPVAGSIVESSDIWTKLVRYDSSDSPLGEVSRILISAGVRKSQQQRTICALPAELMWTVLDMLESDDILALSQSCQAMFIRCCDVIARDMRMTSGDWAMRPLAIISKWPADLPQSFLADDLAQRSMQADFIDMGYDYLNDTSNSSRTIRACSPRESRMTAYNYVLGAWTAYRHCDPFDIQSRSAADYLNRLDPFPGRYSSQHYPASTYILKDLLNRKFETCAFDNPQNGKLFYLRNHTVRALVPICNCHDPHIGCHLRSSEPSSTPSSRANHSPTFTLEAIFTMAIRHDRDRTPASKSTATARAGPWTSGPWAGHCFDIVSARRHERECSDQMADTPSPWRDVSSAISTLAAWEHERLKCLDRIDMVGPPAKNGSGKGLKGQGGWAHEARKKIKKKWIGYMDGVYPLVSSLLDQAEDERVGNDLIWQWRGRLEEIISEYEAKLDPARRKKAASGAGVRKRVVRDKSSGKWQSKDVRRSERLSRAIAGV